MTDAFARRQARASGSPYPFGGAECNVGEDAIAAQVLFNESRMPARQCAGIDTRLMPGDFHALFKINCGGKSCR